MNERRRERIFRLVHRLDEMAHDPFAGQLLRDMVPKGSRITAALVEDTLGKVVPRAVADSRGTPAFIAVEEPDGPITFLVISRNDAGQLRIGRPGDWNSAGDWKPQADNTLAEVIAVLRAANEGAPD